MIPRGPRPHLIMTMIVLANSKKRCRGRARAANGAGAETTAPPQLTQATVPTGAPGHDAAGPAGRAGPIAPPRPAAAS